MTKMTKLTWRLTKLPSVEELQALVKDKIISQEEARQILFSSEEVDSENERDKKSLEAEIKFLKELVTKLSGRDNGQIVTVIKEIEYLYRDRPWYQPYTVWCEGQTFTANPSYGISDGTPSTSGTPSTYLCSANSNFSDIKSF
jgi:hypothetical protein